ncbi:MAG: glycosyltransferase family 2 protein [Magnetococcales bacterium]|nr:glycosyltransferase family 2 protein [Magnetococcales bacterium]
MAFISVVIPIFREEAILEKLVTLLNATLEPVHPDYEILFVLDGGKDRSWEILTALAAHDPRIKAIEFSRNFGQHLAISAGLDHCDGDWVVVMDGDLQDRPEVIPLLFRKAMEGYDVVFVARRQRKESRFYLAMVQGFHWLFQTLSGTHTDPDIGNFSILSRQVVENYRSLREELRFYGGIIHWLGFRHAIIPAEQAERLTGTSGYLGWNKRIRLATHIILAHSERPLYISAAIGLIMASGSFLIGLYFLTIALMDGVDVPGWASLMVALFFNTGLILGVLGINGIYLGKIFSAVKQRPLYVVARRIGLP